MLRMPAFEVHKPRTAHDAVLLRATLPDSLFVAGGTDLLPNLKHWLHQPKHLVSLLDLPELRGITREADGTLHLGAAVTLHEMATSPLLAEIPALPLAASLVAGPQHRRMGTIGGNVMLDTRCLFYNQSEEWRKAVGYCLKKDGDWCHVIGSGKSCVAAQSSDTVPVLLGLGARIRYVTSEGPAEVAIVDLYEKDGRIDRARNIPPSALVTGIAIPPRASGHRSTYRKVRTRAAVDYPQLSIAVITSFDGSILTDLSVVVGALLPQPKIVDLDGMTGVALDDAAIAAIAERVFKQVKPQTNLHGAPEWRRHLARVETARALAQLRAL
ncbi:MAG: FAD binding domain-containing protein [Deltaproteobacteria bacterium]|nr:FAD binding domain-containing protein [Deltaproteobacteria bacterium]